MSQNWFANNSAVKGGVVFYTSYPPFNDESNVFDTNTAQYGPNVASYPVWLIFQNHIEAVSG